jgi:hypothetical protein
MSEYYEGHIYLKKSELKDKTYYKGECRNASVAMWDSENQCFWYMREKFGAVFKESICHPEDDNGYDLFLPEEETQPAEFQVIKS